MNSARSSWGSKIKRLPAAARTWSNNQDLEDRHISSTTVSSPWSSVRMMPDQGNEGRGRTCCIAPALRTPDFRDFPVYRSDQTGGVSPIPPSPRERRCGPGGTYAVRPVRHPKHRGRLPIPAHQTVGIDGANAWFLFIDRAIPHKESHTILDRLE